MLFHFFLDIIFNSNISKHLQVLVFSSSHGHCLLSIRQFSATAEKPLVATVMQLVKSWCFLVLFFFAPSFRRPMLNCFEWLPRWRGQRWWTTRHGAERRSEWGQHECLGNFCCPRLKHFSAAKLTAVPLRSELPRWNGNGLSALLVDLWRLTHSSASSHWGSDIYISYQCSTSFAKTKWL